MNEPIELTTCRNLICADCLCQWLITSPSMSCPCCPSNHLSNLNTIKPGSDITLRAMGTMEVICNLCMKKGSLKNHTDHIKSKCKSANYQQIPLNADKLLTRPKNQPLSPFQEQLQAKLISRSLQSSSTLHVTTRGQVSILFKGYILFTHFCSHSL